MDEYWTNLHDSLNRNDIENVKRLLNTHEKDANLKDIQIIKILLKQKDSQIIYLTTESIAEWAKIEKNRHILTEQETLELLLELLNSKENTLNVVRALGNICYENENAAKLLNLEKILAMFYESTDIALLTKISGLLLNIFISSQDLQTFDKNKLLAYISSKLNGNSGLSVDKTCLYSYLLQIVYTLMAEYESEITFCKKIYERVVTIFKNSNIPELELVCLQILYNASEQDEVQKLLAESNVCERIIELIDKYEQLIDDEESRSILKMACDLINNILIEDESMKLLYDQGRGKVYLNCIKWLDCDDNELLSTAIMAIGNFARNDENCIAIVKEGISKKLIGLLNKYTTENPNIKLLHSLLSTLKNLVVPCKNKSIILEEGLIQTVKPIFEIDQDVVIFKLLGTLRLVIDGQEKAAKDLISQRELLEKLVKLFDNTYHLGVKREVSRLLAWLIKSCYSWNSMRNILQVERTIDCLVSMFSSEDYIMENEALISLNLLSAATIHANELTENKESTSNDEILKIKFEERLIKLKIAVVLPYVRIFSHNHKIAENLISLLEKFFQSSILLEHFIEKNVCKILTEVSHNLKEADLLDKSCKIISILSEK